MMIEWISLVIGFLLFFGSMKLASKIKENTQQYQFLMEIGRLGFWLIFLGGIFFIWG